MERDGRRALAALALLTIAALPGGTIAAPPPDDPGAAKPAPVAAGPTPSAPRPAAAPAAHGGVGELLVLLLLRPGGALVYGQR